MGLKEVASAASLWRGWDYYKENRVLKWEQTGENTYDGIVKGSEGNSYAVHIDTAHVRSSKCSCPFAEGRRVVCKHMIALFFTAVPEEAEAFQRDIDEWEAEEDRREAEEDERRKLLLKRITDYVNSLTEEEIREKLIEIMFINEADGYDDEDWDDNY